LLFSAWQLLNVHALDQPFNRQSQSKRLKNYYRLRSSIFAARCTRAEKVGENKTVGQQHIWGQTLLIIQTNFFIITVKDNKKIPK
jgi:hypothetical protein